MNKIHPVYAIVATYFMFAILTYGYAFNHTKDTGVVEKVSGSFLCAVVFPLYWSTVIFEPSK
jgi:hypothetical protein